MWTLCFGDFLNPVYIYIFFWSKCVKQTGSGGCCSVGEKKKSPRRWGSTESSVKSFLLLLTVCLRKSYIINDKQITELSPADTSIRCEQEPGGGRRKEEGEGAGKLPAGRKMLTNKEHTSLFSLSFRMRFIQCVCVDQCQTNKVFLVTTVKHMARGPYQARLMGFTLVAKMPFVKKYFNLYFMQQNICKKKSD